MNIMNLKKHHLHQTLSGKSASYDRSFKHNETLPFSNFTSCYLLTVNGKIMNPALHDMLLNCHTKIKHQRPSFLIR